MGGEGREGGGECISSSLFPSLGRSLMSEAFTTLASFFIYFIDACYHPYHSLHRSGGQQRIFYCAVIHPSDPNRL